MKKPTYKDLKAQRNMCLIIGIILLIYSIFVIIVDSYNPSMKIGTANMLNGYWEGKEEGYKQYIKDIPEWMDMSFTREEIEMNDTILYQTENYSCEGLFTITPDYVRCDIRKNQTKYNELMREQ